MTNESTFSLSEDDAYSDNEQLALVNLANTECFEQSTCPSNFDPRDLGKRIRKGYQMKIKKGTNRVVLMKFLLAKFFYSKEGVCLEEYLLIFHLYFEMLDISDPLFVKKYEDDLYKIGLVISKLNGAKVFPIYLKESFLVRAKNILKDFLPTSREYYGLAGQRDLRQSFRLLLNDTIVIQAPPPKRFIGVGYKDKGTCRDPAFDGTPGWQFYARYFANLEREAEESDSSDSVFPTEFD